MKKGRLVSQQEMGQSWMVPDDLPHNYETGDFSEAVESVLLQRDKRNTILQVNMTSFKQEQMAMRARIV